jgi:adenylate cyclase
MFADVSGSTRLYETMGDAVAVKAIDRCVSIMRQHTEACGGRVVKTIGDEVMATFTDASDAAQAAVEMQLDINKLPRVGRIQMGIRIGFHFGPVVERDGDVFGDTVNLAARLSGLATKGQIITTRETVNRVSPMLKSSCRYLYGMPIRGKEQQVDIFEVVWQVTEDATSLASERNVRPDQNAKLRLVYGDTEIILDDSREALSLGRDVNCDLVVRDRNSSRNHGRIERRMGKFVLKDNSANGTFVTIEESDREIVLQREEFTLRGHGWIAFGQSRKTATETVEYFCE